MSSRWFSLIEVVLVYGLILGWAGWQWWGWRKWRRQQALEQREDPAGPPETGPDR